MKITKLHSIVRNLVIFLFSFSGAVNVYFYIENKELKSGVAIYKEIVNDYSGGNIENVERAVSDSIETNKKKLIKKKEN